MRLIVVVISRFGGGEDKGKAKKAAVGVVAKKKEGGDDEEIHFGIRIKFGFIRYFRLGSSGPSVQRNKRTAHIYLLYHGQSPSFGRGS
jgi:hypothetical protein